MTKKLVLILAILLYPQIASAAIVEGTNAGFCLSAPSADPAGTATAQDDTGRATKFTSPADINTVTEIGWWSDQISEEANFEVGIYADNGSGTAPGAAVYRNQTNAKGLGAGWKAVTGISVSLSPSTVYWIAVQVDNTVTTTSTDGSTTGAPYRRNFDTAATTLPDPWADDGTSENILAFYAVYTQVSDRRIIFS